MRPPARLVDEGPLVRVRISATAAVVAAGASERRLNEVMLIDTGARHSMLEAHVIEALGIDPIDYCQMYGHTLQPEERPRYLINMEVKVDAGTVTLETVVVAAPDRFGEIFPGAGLLGRDFLRLGRLTYDGPTGAFRFEVLPSHIQTGEAD